MFWVASWAAMYGLWLLYVDTLAVSELVVGTAAAAVGATALDLLRRRELLPFRPRWRWLVRAWRLPVRLVTDFGRVMLALWRHLVLRRPMRGRFRAFSFPVGGNTDRASARRAVAAAGASFTPNAYVVGFDADQRLILLHELVAQRRKTPLLEA